MAAQEFYVRQEDRQPPRDGTAILGFFPRFSGYVARQDVRIVHWSGWGGGFWEDQGGSKISDSEMRAWRDVPWPSI